MSLWAEKMRYNGVRTSCQYVFNLRERMEETLQIAREELDRSQTRYKHYYDKNVCGKEFKHGDSVLVLLPTYHNKLLMQWQGPFWVEEVVGLMTLESMSIGNGRSIT